MISSKHMAIAVLCITCSFALFGCGEAVSVNPSSLADLSSQKLTESDIVTDAACDNANDGEHTITVDNETADYENVNVSKTGKASGDEADFYGDNAAVFATNGATVTLSDLLQMAYSRMAKAPLFP